MTTATPAPVGAHRRCLAPSPPRVSRVRREIAVALADSRVSAAHARQASRQALARWRVDGDVAEDIVLMVDELVTNAVEHGRGPVWLRLRLTHGHSLVCEVGDGSRELPALRRVGPDGESGRGLMLVEALSEAFGARVTAIGKVVWFRHQVSPPG